MPSDNNSISSFFAEFAATRGSSGPIGELAALLATEDADVGTVTSLHRKHGVAGEEWFRKQLLDLALEYLDGRLALGAMHHTALVEFEYLKRLLRIRPGDFGALRPVEVSRVINGQLERFLADGELDRSEEMAFVEWQAAFDLSYDQLMALCRSALERTMTSLHAGLEHPEQSLAERARIARQITELEPLYAIATLRPRSLGALL